LIEKPIVGSDVPAQDSIIIVLAILLSHETLKAEL